MRLASSWQACQSDLTKREVRNPSPGSHLTMLATLSPKGRGKENYLANVRKCCKHSAQRCTLHHERLRREPGGRQSGEGVPDQSHLPILPKARPYRRLP